MKQFLSLTLALALTAALFTGCGCTASNVSNHPGGMITEESTVMPHPTATHATEPRETTLPHMTEPSATTLPRATEGTEPTTNHTTPTETTVNRQSRNTIR